MLPVFLTGKKPGGKTGMVVLGLLGAGGLMLFYKALPFLITLASNTLYLGLLLGLIAGIIYLLCDPKFRKICSATYFMLMRKLTGLVIEIDPIAIVEQRIRDMQKKSADELAMFTDAMDFMAKDISDKIGEMEHVIDSTTGIGCKEWS